MFVFSILWHSTPSRSASSTLYNNVSRRSQVTSPVSVCFGRHVGNTQTLHAPYQFPPAIVRSARIHLLALRGFLNVQACLVQRRTADFFLRNDLGRIRCAQA